MYIIFNLLLRLSSRKETLNGGLTRQTSATLKAHAHGALLTDIANVANHLGDPSVNLGTPSITYVHGRYLENQWLP